MRLVLQPEDWTQKVVVGLACACGYGQASSETPRSRRRQEQWEALSQIDLLMMKKRPKSFYSPHLVSS
jgi:hypothetical protein